MKSGLSEDSIKREIKKFTDRYEDRDKGIQSEEFKEFQTYFDGVTGDIISLDNGIKTKYETSQLIGLNNKEINVLKLILKSKQLSTTEISFKTGYSNPDNSLILYMHFDNSTDYGENSTHIFDYSRNNNNGTMGNGNEFINKSGKFGCKRNLKTPCEVTCWIPYPTE